ncbi:MAG: AGE family epimerase/isomerase, partial [Acidihalobacter sp.]
TNHAYGLAFVLLAYASAARAGIAEARPWMDETRDLLETRFWDADAGLYRDEADASWCFTAYRGQNANMHMCEALLTAYETSGEQLYLDRALSVADHMTRRQAAKAGGLVWEHYNTNWEPDWDYNLDNPKHLFRPWGFQPGHQTEWAKLLLILERHAPRDWQLPTAQHNGLVFRIDHEYGAWYRILRRDNSKYSDEKSPAGKVDYHTMGACYEVLGLLDRQTSD